MKARYLVAFIIPLALLALGASPATDADWKELVRQGNTAFERGDLNAAAALYEKAEQRATEPRLVAYNLATVRLAQAQKLSGPDAAAQRTEAEQLFRCCIARGDERRGRALAGLGDCLAQKAGNSDGPALIAAIDAYEAALREPSLEAPRRADVRHNLQKARLALLQLRLSHPDEKPPEHKDPGANDNNPPDRPPNNPNQGTKIEPGSGDGSKNPGSKPVPSKGTPSDKATPTDDQGPGGAANKLPNIPDQADLPPLPPGDAAAHLEIAARRVWQERQQHREGKSAPPADRLKNW